VFRNILVCVDGSAQGEQALTEAIDLADCQRSRLTILTAITRPPAWATTPMTAAGIEPLAGELEAEARTAQCRAVARVPECVPVTKVLSERPIREALAAELARGRYDLVVIGAAAHRSWARTWRGRVSRYLLRCCEIPMLIVTADDTPAAAALSIVSEDRAPASASLRARASG
jgi:nucleotide-binding universal stress UspA family protein